MFDRKSFNVDFTIVTRNLIRTRQRRVINQSQLPGSGSSQFSVQSYLQNQYPGTMVEINSMEEM